MNPLTVDFRQLIPMAGGTIEGARVLFERLVVALMRKVHGDVANVRAKRGDWGIDCFSGTLAGGSVVVWQAKYFLDGLGDDQQGEIRKSFKSLMNAADQHGFKVTTWTLCVPCQLSPDERRWWDGWKARNEKAFGVMIDLKDEDGLRELLYTRDAEAILYGTFGDNRTWIRYFVEIMQAGDTERDILDLPDPEPYDEAMFIRQLRAADVMEVSGAKCAFFNAELLEQEVHDKADPHEIQELKNISRKILVLWENRFNVYLHDSTVTPARFYGQVMEAIETQHGSNLKSRLTQASFVHKQGISHQLADRCRIGWVRNFRDRFVPSKGESA